MLTIAFRLVVPTRTTLRALPYCKNDAAVKKYEAVLVSGVPNTVARSFSELTLVTVSTGPQLKAPAKPPIEVETAGTTFVRSISLTCTPCDT
jgi:hypothetical protein